MSYTDFEKWEKENESYLIDKYYTYLRDMLDDKEVDIKMIEDYWCYAEVEYSKKEEE